MRIKVIGGGAGGLYFALLTKKAKPQWDIEVIEQNRDDDTFGFGVVFSDDTLDEFLCHDPQSYARIREKFAYWDDVAIHYKGHEARCGGNGFCGLSRIALLKHPAWALPRGRRPSRPSAGASIRKRSSKSASPIPISSWRPTASIR